MHSLKFLALGALARYASAQTCTEDIEISEPTPSFDCEVIDADVTVSSDIGDRLVIDGPEEIRGDFLVSNATGLISISSTTLETIEGTFTLDNCEFLDSINMDALRTISTLRMNRLTRLRSLAFGSEGVTSAEAVYISDTNLNDLSGLKLATVDTININNNHRLANFNSDLVNVTAALIINNNGDDFEISLPLLESAGQIEVANTRSFEVPLLETVSGSLSIDFNPEMEEFSAPNLTTIEDDLAFRRNEVLANISFPVLTQISGGLAIINNTELLNITFPSVEVVGGGINMRGNFESVEMPALEDVTGEATVWSSTDIEEFCGFFNDADDDGRIRGGADCVSNSDNVEEENGDDSGGDSSDSNGDDEEEDDDGAAGLVGVNFVVLGLSLVAGIAQLL